MTQASVSFAGNLTGDPELRYTPSGAAVANFTVAVTPRVKDGENWRDGETSFFGCAAWPTLAEHLADSLAKGDRVLVHGTLRQRSWQTDDGERRSAVEVQAEEVGPSLKWGHRQASAHPRCQRRPVLALAEVRPGRRQPSRPRASEIGALMQARSYPTRPTTLPPVAPSLAALHLLRGIWIASCPSCGYQFATARTQQRCERGPPAAPTPSAERTPNGRLRRLYYAPSQAGSRDGWRPCTAPGQVWTDPDHVLRFVCAEHRRQLLAIRGAGLADRIRWARDGLAIGIPTNS